MKKKNFRFLLVIIVFCLIAAFTMIPVFTDKFNAYANEGINNFARAYSESLAIENGESTKVFSNLAKNFGYSWNLFKGPLAIFIFAIVNKIFSSWIISYKFLLFLGMAFSGITMYMYVNKITKDYKVGIISGILYMTMPYHFSNMCVRNAFPEFVSFIFIPLVFLGLYNILHKDKKDFYFVIGLSLLILTDNVISGLTIMFLIAYLAVNLTKLNDKDVRNRLLFLILIVLALTAFFTLPMLETKLSTVYQESNEMLDVGKTRNNSLEFKDFIITLKGKIPFELGPIVLIILCFSIPVFRNLGKDYGLEYILFFIFTIVSIFACTKYFPWNLFSQTLGNIENPWKVLVLINFFTAFICAINIGTLINNLNFWKMLIVAGISLVYVTTLFQFVPKDFQSIDDIENYEITDIYDINRKDNLGIGDAKNIPSLAYNNAFYLLGRDDRVVVLKGNGKVENTKKEGNTLTTNLTTKADNTIYEFPFIYYPGYTVTLDGLKVPGFETENGMLGISLIKSDRFHVKVEYTETSLMKMSKIFSIIALIGYIISEISLYTSDKKAKNEKTLDLKENV